MNTPTATNYVNKTYDSLTNKMASLTLTIESNSIWRHCHIMYTSVYDFTWIFDKCSDVPAWLIAPLARKLQMLEPPLKPTHLSISCWRLRTFYCLCYF